MKNPKYTGNKYERKIIDIINEYLGSGYTRTKYSGGADHEGAVATDPSVIPIGTKLDILGLPNGWDGIYTAEDVGGTVKDLKIDVFRESKLDALQINQMVWVRILEEE